MLRVEPEIKRDYVDRGTVRLAFHPFLDRGDAPATTLHAAAECAGAQAPLAFWRMHDLIFEHQGDLWQAEAADVLGYAAELGLDVATFAACLNDPVTAEKLARLVTTHATPVGSGTVARTRTIPIGRRAEAAVIAWMRHQTTGYDTMPIARVKGRRREVRRMLAGRSRELLQVYRSGPSTPEDCPLAAAARRIGENP